MPHVEPIAREALEEYESFFQIAEQMMGGFVPNSLFTMAHRPEILEKFMMLAGTVNGPGTVDPGLKQLVAYVASNAAGCRYCQAHTSTHASHAGVTAEKIEHAFVSFLTGMIPPSGRFSHEHDPTSVVFFSRP